MKNISSKLIILLFSILLFKASYSQDSHTDLPKEPNENAIYTSVGLVFIAANYERLLFTPKEKRFFTSYWVQFGYGIWGEPFGGAGNYYRTSVNAMTGAKKGHLELSIGMLAPIDNVRHASESRNFFPSTVVGYRYQKSDGNFIFRTGVGIPYANGSTYTIIDYFHISTGFCF